MNEKIKDAVKAVAGIEEALDSIPIPRKAALKAGFACGMYTGPIGTGILIGCVGAYGMSKLAQAVIKKNNW